MDPSERYVVVVKEFRPTDKLLNSSVYPILVLQIGDLLQTTNRINSDWAFGCSTNSADPGLFPLRFTRPLKTLDRLEASTINMINRWSEKTMKAYASGEQEKEFDRKASLISNLTSTFECQDGSSSPKDLPAMMERGCEFFGMGLHLIDKDGQNLRVENYEFNDLVQLTKQKRLELSGRQSSTSRNSSINTNDQNCSLLIRINLTLAQQISQIDNELVMTFIQEDTTLPCFESYRIVDLPNPSPIFLLLEDFDPGLLGNLQIKIDCFVSKLQSLPGFFIDESQHEMLCFKDSMYTPLNASISSTIFTKSIELNLFADSSTPLSGQLSVEAEFLVHRERSQLIYEIKQRQLHSYHSLLPLNAKPLLLATNDKDGVYLTFDFSNLSLPDVQSDKLQLIIHALDATGNIIKDVFLDSNGFDIIGLPIENNVTSRSYLQYFFFGLKCQLKLNLDSNYDSRIKLPRNAGGDIHLRLLFYGSNADGRLSNNLPVAAAFLRLLDNNTLIGMGSTEMFLHKVDSTSSLVSLKYLKFTSTKRDLRSHPIVPENELPSVPVHIATLSSHFTHDQNVLALLNCTGKTAIIKAIDQLSSISSDFSLFLPRFLPKLFDKLGTDNELDRRIFGFVNVLFKRSEYPMEHHLKKVIETEVENLTNPRIYGPLFSILNSSIVPLNLSEQDTAFWIDTVLGSPSMTKIIILTALADPQLINYKPNFALQHLNCKFTLLLNNLISNLRDKTTKLDDHQWIHLKHIPEVMDVLLHYDIFDARSLALSVIELVRAVPSKVQTAKIEIVRSVTKTRLFEDFVVRRELLLPEFMPIVVESLNNASTRPEDTSKSLNSTVALLINILHLIRKNLQNDTETDRFREEFMFVTRNCLFPTIRCCNASVYNGHGEIEMLSQTLFITLMDLLDAQTFAAYLESFEDESITADMLIESLKALRPFTETSTIPIFNEQPVKVAIYRQCVKYFQFIKCAIFDNRTFLEFQPTVWKELMHVIYLFLMNTNNDNLSLYSKQIAFLRSASVECLRSMWFSLSVNKKLALGRNTFESVLDLLSSIQNKCLNRTLLSMFGDILKTEGYHYIEMLDEKPDQSFTIYKLLHNKLMKRPGSLINRATLCSELENEMYSVVLCDKKFSWVKKLNALPRFLKLINYGREALFRNNSYEIGLIFHKLLEFWRETNEPEMALEYIIRLYKFHKSNNDFVEAAFSLQNYAVRLNWTKHADSPELSILSKRLKIQPGNESDIKEQLFWEISELFGRANAWELAVPTLKELAYHYETLKLDYEQLGNVMGKLKGLLALHDNYQYLEYYHLIGQKLRLSSLFFIVAFYGTRHPEYLRNKRFVFRGQPVEMLDSFRQKVIQKFGCELLQSLDEDPSKLSTLDGKYATVACVQPLPGSEFIRLSDAENPLLSWFYKHNSVDTFIMTRPIVRMETEWTERFGVTEATKLWIRRTEFSLNQALPGILPFQEVVSADKEMEPLNPLQAACVALSSTNDELSVTSRLVHSGFVDDYLNALLGQLRGILQAFVGGGIQNYEIFLSEKDNELLTTEEMLADKARLRSLLIQQAKLLDYGLGVHAFHLNESSKPLHDSLVDSFEIYHQKVQQMCGIEFQVGISRKTNIVRQNSTTKHPNRLSADSSLFEHEPKVAFPSRSMSINCAHEVHQKSGSKQKHPKNDVIPLPPRRSNRHSTKPLKHNRPLNTSIL